MSRRDERDWRRLILKARVVRSPRGALMRVHPDVRLMLVEMSFTLTDNLVYSRGRKRIADALGCSEATITRWLREAVETGLLAHLSVGREGHHAEYQALFPELVVGSEARSARSTRGKIGRPKAKKGDPLRAAQHDEPPLKVSSKQPEDEWLSPGDPPF